MNIIKPLLYRLKASFLRPVGRESRKDASDVHSLFRVKVSLTFVIFQVAEERVHAFVDKELKKLWRDIFLHAPQGSETQREKEEEGLDCKNEDQRRRAIEGVVDITKLCLMELNQDELAGKLRSGR